jgi:hypothetical protein
VTDRVPTRSREIVKARERGRCLRCGGPGIQWCHRRRRNVADGHQHCPCNGWWGCLDCHQLWQHQNPREAEETGFAVSSYSTTPGSVPIETWYGVLYLECNGDVRFKVDVPSGEPDE